MEKKEAMKILKDFHDKSALFSVRTALDTVIPELKDSEDEKIRKHIVTFIMEAEKMGDAPEECAKWLAWLEKQGRESKKVSIWKHWKDGIAGNEEGKLIFLTKVGNTYNLSSCLSFECDYIELSELDNLLSEKQDEHKPADSVEPKFKVKYAGDEYNVFYVKDYVGVTYYGIEDEPNHIDYVKAEDCEIISEQKQTDNVKPKFNEHEWIIHQGTDNVYQVVAIVNNQYQLRYGNNYTTQYCEDVDKCARSWDVTKDAKDGDVLVASDDSIFIFKGIVNHGCKYYIALTDIDTIKINDKSEHCWESVTAVHPATEEQRNTLMKAIVDAGYIFDVYNKELKKIIKL